MTMGQIVQIVTCVCAVTGGLKMAGCDRLWRAGNYKRQGRAESDRGAVKDRKLQRDSGG